MPYADGLLRHKRTMEGFPMRYGMSVIAVLMLAGCTIATVETPVLRDRDQGAPGKPGEETSGGEGVEAHPSPPDASQPIVGSAEGGSGTGVDAGSNPAPQDAGWDGAQSAACKEECRVTNAKCGEIYTVTPCNCGTCPDPYTVCGDFNSVNRNRCVCPDTPNPCVQYNAANPSSPVPAAHGYSVLCSSYVPTAQLDRCMRIPDFYCCP